MKRSKFSLSYTHLFSCDMGELIPAGLTEVLPGDSMMMNTTALVRCAPMVTPPMHPVRVRIHHWFVPHRLVWTSFEDFITGGPDGNNASVFPTDGGSVTVGSLRNYLGAPIVGSGLQKSILPIRAYNEIWNHWYRDQDLQTALPNFKSDGADGSSNVTLQNCAWEKDYFTSARPWEQKGTAVTIPLTGTGTVSFFQDAAAPTSATLQRSSASANTAVNIVQAETGSPPTEIFATANLSSAGITVNALRANLAFQRFQEAAARYGSRYVEYLARLGVRSSDGRLAIPEYLGGGSQNIQFSEVIQTAADGTNPVSTLRGHGITALRSNRFKRFFEEHGYIMTMFSVLPKTIYMNGLFRTWNRRTKYDFWQPELENIGQQAVLNKEVRANHANPDGVFGYQDRFDEYRRSESRVSGEFATSTLNSWHFARDFTSDPALNSTFVSAVPPERPFAAPSADVLYVQCHHSIKARRLVSKRARPRTF